jgi:hypothetical protein
MTSPHRSHTPNPPDGPRWWVKPAVISAMNIAAVLVVELGTPAELLARDGAYAALAA